MLRVAGIETATEVEGPGCRFALWLQGCSLLCEGCCNPQMQPFDGGILISACDLAQKIIASGTDGLTIVGGEPFDQIEGVNRLFDCLQKTRYERGIIVFTGYDWQEIEADAKKLELAQRCDLLIAGRFDRKNAPDSRRWIGSRNQTTHFFSEKFADLQQNWPEHKAEIEIHIDDGQISINGFPLGEDSDFEKIFNSVKESKA
ncbi:MAG: hypothetical protein Kow0029_09390 [Candidatus Rifleibacteriota bacterium]